MPTDKPAIIMISQVYVPDPASVGQHMHDAAAELVRRGWRVVVYASAGGYEDSSVRYPKREVLDGVEVRRLGLSSFGKKALPIRVLAGVLFLIQAIARGMFVKNTKGVFVSTSPPFTGAFGTLLAKLKRAALFFWVMDLNPDQLIQIGAIGPKHPAAIIFDAGNRITLRRSDGVVALDRFMAERVNRKVDVGDRMAILPPWPHEDHVEPVEHADNDFRKQHGLDGKFVVMYSGNHGMTTPVTTVLDAALKLQHRDDLVFMFIGGGVGKADVRRVIEEHSPTNIIDLPYQPFDRLRFSLSAADLHVVTMVDPAVGCIHPCKVYGAMAVGRPILFVGPRPSHVTDLLDGQDVGWHAAQGDGDACAEQIEAITALAPERLREMGDKARAYVDERYTQARLLGEFCDVVERSIQRRHPAVEASPPTAQASQTRT
ncbi:MAG: glycosyltransferase family 4 protein [Phycisphaera sp.]|nr:MAG: glycosyltransferase family 4 protein [Phycisphaera sp.]